MTMHVTNTRYVSQSARLTNASNSAVISAILGEQFKPSKQ
jgi:hypothetical protein